MKDRKLEELEKAVDEANQTLDFKYDMGQKGGIAKAEKMRDIALKNLSDYRKTIGASMNRKQIACELIKLSDVLLADSNRFQKAVNSVSYTMGTEVCGNLKKVREQLCGLCCEDALVEMSPEQMQKLQAWLVSLESACKTISGVYDDMETQLR